MNRVRNNESKKSHLSTDSILNHRTVKWCMPACIYVELPQFLGQHVLYLYFLLDPYSTEQHLEVLLDFGLP